MPRKRILKQHMQRKRILKQHQQKSKKDFLNDELEGPWIWWCPWLLDQDACVNTGKNSNLQSCITRVEVPDWMTTSRPVVLIKGKSKGNYRPINCLPFPWEVLTTIFADEIYNHLQENDLLPEERKGRCRIVEVQRTSF